MTETNRTDRTTGWQTRKQNTLFVWRTSLADPLDIDALDEDTDNDATELTTAIIELIGWETTDEIAEIPNLGSAFRQQYTARRQHPVGPSLILKDRPHIQDWTSVLTGEGWLYMVHHVAASGASGDTIADIYHATTQGPCRRYNTTGGARTLTTFALQSAPALDQTVLNGDSNPAVWDDDGWTDAPWQ